MAKKSIQKHQQMLSPENYIRQKVRNLPLYECKMNEKWNKEHFAQITVCRQHANGNFTVCFYLVDLGCLGVKDAGFRFNIDKSDYEDLLEQMDNNSTLITVDYALVHNVIFSALAYAEDLGFKACKEFTQTTRFMLEADTDDVELIEIECGVDGKPFYVNAGHDSDTREKQILNQLEKAVGKGNFDYILRVEEDDDFDEENDKVEDEVYDADDADFEDDNEDEEDDEFENVTYPELRIEFLDLLGKDSSFDSKESAQRLGLLTDEICQRICDTDVVEKQLRKWHEENAIVSYDKYITAKLIGLIDELPVPQLVNDLIDDVFENLPVSENKATKSLLKLEKAIGKTAFTAFLELGILRNYSNKNYDRKLIEYSLQYPDYGLIRLQKQVKLHTGNVTSDFPILKEIFSENEVVTFYEFSHYLVELALAIGLDLDLNKLEAFDRYICEIKLPETIYNGLQSQIMISRMLGVTNYIENEVNSTSNESTPKIVNPTIHSNRTLQFRIQLVGIDNPTVWRQLVVAEDSSFDDLHDYIQVSFGWENCHLYNFTPSGWGSKPEIAQPSEEDEEPVLDAFETELNEYFKAVGDSFIYTYDFGDNWKHKIVLEAIHTDYNQQLPACLSGAGCCPPEDCGGVGGFEHLKKVLGNTKNREHKDMLRWLGLQKASEWDANKFNLEWVNDILIDMY